uniref:Uncharacterized protein n=1 Tax=Anopheles dirus TaxID=7168 RepID=A0A182NBC2_9DIPT
MKVPYKTIPYSPKRASNLLVDFEAIPEENYTKSLPERDKYGARRGPALIKASSTNTPKSAGRRTGGPVNPQTTALLSASSTDSEDDDDDDEDEHDGHRRHHQDGRHRADESTRPLNGAENNDDEEEEEEEDDDDDEDEDCADEQHPI